MKKDGIFYDQFFVYDDYLCYVSRTHTYKEIDLKSNSRIKFEKNIQTNCELLFIYLGMVLLFKYSMKTIQ